MMDGDRQRKNKLKVWFEEHRSESIIVAVIGLLILGAVLWPKPEYPEVPPERLANDPSIGPEDAAVTIIEYADFACSGCKLFHTAGVKEEILEKYEGQVRFVWRDNARISPASKNAAIAAQCAYDQGMFWEYHDLLFENPAGFADQALKNYAAELGLDQQAFDTCLDERRYFEKVRHSMRLAGEHGFSITPAFLVNDEVVIGPPPASYLSELIEAELGES